MYHTNFIDKVVASLDKTYIAEVIGIRDIIENIAIYIIKELKKLNNLYSVIVWEGSNKYVEVLKDEV